MLAVLTLVSAFGIIALDLHFPIRMVFGAVFNPSPLSPMWWMGVFYGGYLCFLLVEVWSMLIWATLREPIAVPAKNIATTGKKSVGKNDATQITVPSANTMPIVM